MRRTVPARPAAVAAGVTAIAVLAAVGASAVPVGAASAPPIKSAQSEYQAAIKAATNETVHFQSDVTQGNVTLRISGDAGTNSGSQSLTVNNGNQTEHMSTEVIGATGYVNGNSTALHNIIGLTTAQSRKHAGQWLSFPMSNSTFSQLAAGLLRSQVASELSIQGPFKFVSDATVNGQHALGIQGSVSTDNGSSVSEILYVPVNGKPLPIEEVTDPGAKTHSTTIHGTVSFSNWGEHVSVPAPAHSSSLLKLAPASTSGATTTTGG